MTAPIHHRDIVIPILGPLGTEDAPRGPLRSGRPGGDQGQPDFGAVLKAALEAEPEPDAGIRPVRPPAAGQGALIVGGIVLPGTWPRF